MSEDDTYSRRGTEVDRYTIVERDQWNKRHRLRKP